MCQEMSASYHAPQSAALISKDFKQDSIINIMDYGYSERRKNKNDKRAKRRFRVYKRGGKYRGNEPDEKNKGS